MSTMQIPNALTMTNIFDFETPKTTVDPLKMMILGDKQGDPHLQLAIS